MKNIMIVDDHLVVREGLKLLLETRKDFNVVGEATNGEDAIKMASELYPDIILMDLYMPVLNGIEATKKLKARHIDIPIIVLTTFNEDNLLLEAISLGVKGFLLKDTEAEELFTTIEKVLTGESMIGKDLNRRVYKIKQINKLTYLEIKTLILVSEGYSNKEIALKYQVSERTIKSRLTNIFNKLGVNNRAQAIAKAIKNNLMKLP